jgi:phosphatidylinositol alpha-1,6-mannosyltransferase
MNSPLLDVISLFPSFESGSFGGVQASGREAWRGILDRIGDQRAKAIIYETGSSKAKAVLRVLTSRRKAKVVLIWHLHLLKLLPFLDNSASRVILFLHGIEAWLKQDALTRLVLNQVDLILSNSDHTWQRFLASNPACAATRHRTVHLGTGSRLPGVTPYPSDPPAALMIGRLNKNENYKGHLQVIAAWPLVLQSVPDAELWVVGDGDLRPTLERAARAHRIADYVKFHGQVSDAKKQELISQSRCLALPSRGEGFGLVYLEAMRMGRPCLASTLDAGREVINPPEAGLAVDPGNPVDIANALQRLLILGTGWNDWSARARARYEDRFTSEQFHLRLLPALFET